VFSKTLLDHFENPRNVGEVEAASAVVEAANPICGDELRLSARVLDGLLVEVRYQTRGCTASIAAGSALTELLTGRAVDGLRVTSAEIEDAVGGLPSTSKHAAMLGVDAVRALSAALRKGGD